MAGRYERKLTKYSNTGDHVAGGSERKLTNSSNTGDHEAGQSERKLTNPSITGDHVTGQSQPGGIKRRSRHLAGVEETKAMEEKVPMLKRKSVWWLEGDEEEEEDINAMETISLEKLNLEDTGRTAQSLNHYQHKYFEMFLLS